MWDLPKPGLEPVSPALAGGFSTTAPPGKSWNINLNPLIFVGKNIRFQCSQNPWMRLLIEDLAILYVPPHAAYEPFSEK